MQHEREGMQNKRNIRKLIQNERRCKEMKTTDDIRWLSTKDAFTPTENWKNHTSCLQGAHRLRKRSMKKTFGMFRVIQKDTGLWYNTHVILNYIYNRCCANKIFFCVARVWGQPASTSRWSRCTQNDDGGKWGVCYFLGEVKRECLGAKLI